MPVDDKGRLNFPPKFRDEPWAALFYRHPLAGRLPGGAFRQDEWERISALLSEKGMVKSAAVQPLAVCRPPWRRRRTSRGASCCRRRCAQHAEPGQRTSRSSAWAATPRYGSTTGLDKQMQDSMRSGHMAAAMEELEFCKADEDSHAHPCPPLRTVHATALAIRPDGIYLDGTAGRRQGIQKRSPRAFTTGRLIALDQDPDAVAAAARAAGRAARHGGAGQFPPCGQGCWRQLGVDGLDGVLLDLGVSSHQLDEVWRAAFPIRATRRWTCA